MVLNRMAARRQRMGAASGRGGKVFGRGVAEGRMTPSQSDVSWPSWTGDGEGELKGEEPLAPPSTADPAGVGCVQC